MPWHFSWKGRLLRAVLARHGATIVSVAGSEARRDLAIVQETRRLLPLLVGDGAALEILAYARAARRLRGTMAEAGVFAGGTARLICEVKEDVPLHLFDVFETLQTPPDQPPRGERAAELRGHFKALHTPRAEVERRLASYPAVHLHPGIFPDTVEGLERERFSFVHIDLDLEPSTRDALSFFCPRMLPGGVIIGDDYHDPGVRRAFDRYFTGRSDTVVPLPWGQVVVVIMPLATR